MTTQTIPVVLGAEQQAAHDGFIQGHEKYSMLTGFAGTGKTFALTQIIRTLKKKRPGIVITLCAYTHRAVFVARRMTIEHGVADMVNFSTVHALLNLKATLDEESGVEVFKKSDFGDKDILDRTDILIVDEISMIGDLGEPKGRNKKREDGEGIFTLLMSQLERMTRVRVLFVGDDQIPPVGEHSTKLFYPAIHKRYGIRHYELKEPQRQALDSPILSYANAWRMTMGKAEPPPELIVTPARAKELMQELYTSEQYASGDTDHVKTICWQNKTVDACNTMIRDMIYGREAADANPIMEGERLVLGRPWKLKEEMREKLIPNNTDLTVLKASPWTDKFKVYVAFGEYEKTYDLALKVLECTVEMQEVMDGEVITVTASVPVLHPDSKAEWQRICDLLVKDAGACQAMYRSKAWKRYYNLYDRYAHYRYNYAVTAHKSQGGSFQHTIVNAWDIKLNKRSDRQYEMVRIMYVALSRPKQGLYIVQ